VITIFFLISTVLGVLFFGFFGFKWGHNNKDETLGWTIFLTLTSMLGGGLIGVSLAAIAIYLPLVMGALITAAFVIFKMEKVRQDCLKQVEAKKEQEAADLKRSQQAKWR
jgi:Na+(H+)/acetate symporter ActP